MAIAIYARQSIEKENSISCETQIEYCKACLRPDERSEKLLTFIDEGFTGANTNRDAFQKMMRQVERGSISKIYVYKLDRISRSLSDFTYILDALDRSETKFSSATEGFDTSTDFGRTICQILMVFAELERKNTAMRVKQAYEHRSEKQFYMGGRRPYGFELTETEINNIKTKMLSLKHEEAEQVKYIFENYAVHGVSLRRLMDNLIANGITPSEGAWTTAKLSYILRNPIYVRADNSIYEYYKRNNTNIISEPSEFDGIHGVQLYGVNKHKAEDMSDMKAVVMQHEGFIEPEIWLTCQKRLANNKQVGNTLSNKTSWLGGKIICHSCKRTMTCTKGGLKADGTRTRYFSCTGKSHNRSCKGPNNPIYADSLEDMIYELISEKLATLKQCRKKISTDNSAKINIFKNQLAEIKDKQDKLTELLLTDMASSATISLVNRKAEELYEKEKSIQKQISMLEDADSEMVSVINLSKKWKTAKFNERKAVCSVLIDKIYIHTDGTAEVVWRI